MAPDEKLETIRSLVADRLDRDVTAVQPESRLSTDLGVDSLDFLDLVFSLEDRFKVKLRGSELAFLTRLGSADEAVMQDGVLTQGALERLSGVIPELAFIPEPRRVTPRVLFGMVTVTTLWRVVSRELDRKDGTGGA